ncbi:glyoxylase-like metal-dependent hydrolase (beta-lactamase superfamily II) [Pararhizobium capsulatum DSM 1112]|uniref:Glyoxylase-like metal-dependent hydrolase (Beta-lactamase superfamily II) n=1 Tax=Pararhizobium capsulatum DSM 1112 TaxID=1121113 RepID=A0ABU0BK98_9HYPH|nr:MBL fold metallo-hydrolase [Pararhizobium capsulatum]MDQ0317870.1 glyoxylase-like metal-dependent hydrolase (beta-lactamase superfamily II) [Pararhizobium capsulatum DSM 1112]
MSRAAIATDLLINQNRRQFLGLGLSLAALSVLPKRLFAAEAPNLRQGAFDITVFSDGYINLPASIVMPEASEEERDAILKRLGGTVEAVPTPSNIPLIRTAKDLILIDVGAGENFQASAGLLEANLKLAGIDPAEITKVVFTHAHPDHTGATTKKDGTLRYPNADYIVGETEWNFWTDPDFEQKYPQPLHAFALGAKRDLFAVKDRVRMVKAGDDIVTGIRVLDTAGHTPGHISLELDGGDGLVITADAATNGIVSFEHPAWKFGFDTDQERAIRNRVKLMDRVAAEKTMLIGYHWAFSGVGHAEREGSAYRYVSLNGTRL